MHALYLILYVIAAICFALSAFAGEQVGSRVGTRFNLLALGLLAWVLVPLIQTAQA